MTRKKCFLFSPELLKIIQVKSLQKRLIGKTELVVRKDLLLQEKERLYHELREILARQPGPELAAQMSAYQQKLKRTVVSMKATAAELNMHHAQVQKGACVCIIRIIRMCMRVSVFLYLICMFFYVTCPG